MELTNAADNWVQTDERTIIGNYSDMVYRIAYEYFRNKYDADDIHQEVFFKYYRKKPVFNSKEHEKAWFIRVTINQCNNVWKMPWNRRKIDKEYDEDVQNNMESTDKNFTEKVLNNMLLSQALKKLSGKERMIIYLYYYEEYKVEEIAGILDISTNSAYVRLNRVRNKLRDLLKGAYKDEEF